MTEEGHPGVDGGSFAVVDPKLTVFALANGMDLAKGPDFRRLEWFTEGLERAILVREDGAGVFRITVMSWPSGRADDREESEVGDGVPADELPGALTDAIDAANALGSPP